MATETKPDKIRRLLAATQTGDSAATDELMHPEITIHEPPSMPYAGSFRGKAGLGELFKGMAVWSEFTPKIAFILGEPSGDQFAVMYEIGFRSAKTGRRTDMQVFELFTFRDGKIADIRPFHWDTKVLADLCS